MRFVALVGIGNADDDYLGKHFDDAGNHVLEGVHQNRPDLGARLRTRHKPQLLLQHRGDQRRTVGAHGEVLQEVLFREVGNRGQRDCGHWGHRHEESSFSAWGFRRGGNFEGVEETADRVVGAGQDDNVDNSCREFLGIAVHWSNPSALAGTSNAANVIDTAVNHPMSTVTSTIPASPSRALARRYSPSGTKRGTTRLAANSYTTCWGGYN